MFPCQLKKGIAVSLVASSEIQLPNWIPYQATGINSNSFLEEEADNKTPLKTLLMQLSLLCTDLYSATLQDHHSQTAFVLWEERILPDLDFTGKNEKTSQNNFLVLSRPWFCCSIVIYIFWFYTFDHKLKLWGLLEIFVYLFLIPAIYNLVLLKLCFRKSLESLLVAIIQAAHPCQTGCIRTGSNSKFLCNCHPLILS